MVKGSCLSFPVVQLVLINRHTYTYGILEGIGVSDQCENNTTNINMKRQRRTTLVSSQKEQPRCFTTYGGTQHYSKPRFILGSAIKKIIFFRL